MFPPFTKFVLKLCRKWYRVKQTHQILCTLFLSFYPLVTPISQSINHIPVLPSRTYQKFYVTLRSRPQFVRVQEINLPRKTDFPFSNYKTKRCVIFIHRFTLILVVDTRSVERTVDRVRICKFVTHSDVNKSICQRQSNWYRLLSTFRSKCRDVELEFAFSSRSFD